MVKTLALSCFLLSLSLSPPAHAWNTLGHRLVCEIAWQKIKPTTKQWLQSLRKQANSRYKTFAQSCSWADRARNTTHQSTYSYHFVNVDRNATHVNIDRDCPGGDCILSAIQRYQHLLSQPARGKKALQRQHQALMFLGHFIADIHQPLHVSYAHDRGGNLQAITINGKQTNAHSLFDGDLLKPSGPITKQAEKLIASISARKEAHWTTSSIVDWANESYSITRAFYSRYVDGTDTAITVDEDFRQKYEAIVIEQIQKAGVRLAETLNNIAP